MNLLRQITLLFAACVAGDVLSALIGGLLPGNVLGLIVLLALLLTRCVRLEAIETVADFFLNHMVLLFLPATLSILQVYDSIRTELFQLAAICTATTFLTAATAGYTVLFVRRLQTRKGVSHK